MAHDAFISHSSKDKTIADATCAYLEASKIRCWVAPRDIRPGGELGRLDREGDPQRAGRGVDSFQERQRLSANQAGSRAGGVLSALFAVVFRLSAQ